MSKYSVRGFAEQLADREAIRHCLMRYCRGVDRLDEEILKTAYWPDAEDDHISFVGRADDFIQYAMKNLTVMKQTQHMLGNILIEMTSADIADCETYYQAFHCLEGRAGVFDIMIAGRYVDRLEKRNDEWRIAKRFVIIDWFRRYPDTGDFSKRPLGFDTKPGGRKPDDRSYELAGLR